MSEVKKPFALGDLIAEKIKRLGVQPCGGCKKRQEMLNKLGKAVMQRGKESK